MDKKFNMDKKFIYRGMGRESAKKEPEWQKEIVIV